MRNGRTDDDTVWVVGDSDGLTLPTGVALAADRESADVIVAFGESSLQDLASEGCSTPVLPVEAGSGIRSLSADDVEAGLASVRSDHATITELPVLRVAVGDEQRGRALKDVMLVTTEAAHISEFSIETPTDQIAEFRADGVVVATAAGTSGYASRLGAPVFDPAVEAAAVVPVAAFATALDHWVVTLPDTEPLVRARVTREEAGVSLLVDDRVSGTVPPFTDVTVTVDGRLSVYSVPESPSCFQRGDQPPRGGTPD